MLNEILSDVNGNTSSKRVTGFSMVIFAMVLSMVLFILSIFKAAVNSDVMIEVIKLFIYSGTGLLGVGVIENFATKPVSNKEDTNNS